MHARHRRTTHVWLVVGGIAAGAVGSVVVGPYALLAATLAAGAAGALTLADRHRTERRLAACPGASDLVLRPAACPPEDDDPFVRVVVPPVDGYPVVLPHGALPQQRRASAGS